MMAVDITSLEIRVQALEANAAANSLDGLENSAKRTERATDNLTKSFVRLAGPAALVAATVKGLKETVRVTREFDVLNAGLVTATESTEGAIEAFSAIQKFAQDTPYDLQQVTDGFITLVNRGLDPSERALISYGDTAASLGRTLSDYINAVAQATVGEFETLKTFGVKAKNQGDSIDFTFRGVTTSIKNSSRDIEEYLIRLGEVNFNGAMERRMDSLDGAMSNFADAWDKLVLDISQSGLGDAIDEAFRGGIDVLEAFGRVTREISGNMTLEDKLFSLENQMRELGTEVMKTQFVLEGLNESGADPEKIELYTKKLKILQAGLEELATTRVDLQSQVQQGDALAKFRALSSGDPTAINKLKEQLMTEEEAITAAYQQRNKVIEDRMIELNNAVLAGERALAAETDEIRKKSISDKLAGFVIERDAYAVQQEDLLARSLRMYEEKKGQSLQSVKEMLTNEAEAISLEYDKRQRIIDADHTLTKEKREALSRANLELFDQETAELVDKQRRRQFELEEARIAKENALEELDVRLMTELELLLYHHDLVQAAEREHLEIMNEIKSSQYLDDVEQAKFLSEEKIRYEQAVLDAKLNMNRAALHNAALTAQGLGDIAAGLYGKQSKAAKAAFAVQKALSVAEAVLNIQTAMSNAMRLKWPLNLIEYARVAGLGASIVSTIKSTNYAGAYDKGGYIPAGQFGIVGEYGPEVIEGPTHVTSRKETAAMARQAMQGGSKDGGVNKTVSIGTLLELNWTGEAPTNPQKFASDVVEVLIDEMREGGALEALS